jgi:hypothetical protein
MENKRPMKVSQECYDFYENMGSNRVKVGSEKRNLPLCILPDVIVKYFKLNNDRYIELCKLKFEYNKNGTN